MDDFLSLPPELTYESLSDHSHSPSSNYEQGPSTYSQTHSWDPKALCALDDTDPFFSMIDGELFAEDDLYHEFTNPSELKAQTFSRDTTSSVPCGPIIEVSKSPIQYNAPDSNASGRSKRNLSESSHEDKSIADYASDFQSIGLAQSEDLADRGPAPKKRTRATQVPKVSHNIIEKRYRLNLNEKILYLRDVVPILKAEADSGNNKQAKGRIISGATDYIKELEARNAKLVQENTRLTAKLHGEDRTQSGGVLSKMVVGGLAGMMCVSGMSDTHTQTLTKRSFDDPPARSYGWSDNFCAIVKMLLLIAAILYLISPELFSSTKFVKSRPLEKYSQSPDDDCMQEDVQENRELMHNNVSAMLEMPCDRPGLFKRILQGCFVLALKIIIGQSGWNVLINKGLDYTLTNQRACSLLIETQLLGGDKYINQAKLFLSAIQSLGYRMPKEMRAVHFAMVCYGYAPQGVLLRCVSLFWYMVETDEAVLQLPLDQLLSRRVLQALWSWTNGIEDPLIASIRNDETIDNPLKQLSAIHASLLQNQILRTWIRGTASSAELDKKMQTLLLYCPEGSRILTNSLYLQRIIEPNDWLEQAMLSSVNSHTSDNAATISPREVTMQLRCCVLLHLLERDSSSEEVCDVLRMAEVETSALLPGYSSRIVASCIAKHRLDDDDGISEALRKISAKIGLVPRLDLR